MEKQLKSFDFHKKVEQVWLAPDSKSLALVRHAPFKLGASTNIYPACFANLRDSQSFDGEQLFVFGFGR